MLILKNKLNFFFDEKYFLGLDIEDFLLGLLIFFEDADGEGRP